jgi:hypothetical protein
LRTDWRAWSPSFDPAWSLGTLAQGVSPTFVFVLVYLTAGESLVEDLECLGLWLWALVLVGIEERSPRALVHRESHQPRQSDKKHYEHDDEEDPFSRV